MPIPPPRFLAALLLLSLPALASPPPPSSLPAAPPAAESLDSPDGALQLLLAPGPGSSSGLTYEIRRHGVPVILPSALGLRTDRGDLTAPAGGLLRRREVNLRWRPFYGPRSEFLNHYREAVLPLQSPQGLRADLVFRVFSGGVAFRYEIPAQPGPDRLVLLGEDSEFRFTDNFPCFTIQRDVERERYHPQPLRASAFSLSPMLVHAGDLWVALNEAAIYDLSHLHFLNPHGDTAMRAGLGRSEVTLPARTPWRVIQIADTAGGLIDSPLIPNLNEPCDPAAFAWVQPGKVLWDHRILGAVAPAFTYGKNPATYRRMIDFAAAHGLRYILIDGGWYTAQGPLFPKPDQDIPGVLAYARQHGIGVLLYLDRGNKAPWDLETVLAAFREWGVAGIKYGFLSREHGFESDTIDRQAFVRATRAIVALCARYHMLLNFHDRPVQPGGEQYTWPHLITQEYGKAQQDGPPRPGERKMDPDLAVSTPFLNGLNVAHDMSNGFYDLAGFAPRTRVDPLGLDSTVVAETARCLVNFSPLLILPDHPDAYAAKSDLFAFLQLLPSTWDDSRVLAGEPGEFIVVARRSGDRWFVAGYTDENARPYTLPLDFLPPGDFNLTLYLDGPDAHFQTHKESYRLEHATVSASARLPLHLAPGGGFCALLSPR